MFRSESGLFYALEVELKKAKEPLTCNQLYDLPQIRDHALSANRVSDYLGGLWRKGLVLRVPAPRMHNSSARWAYVWKREEQKGKKEAYSPQAAEFIKPFKDSTSVFSKPNLDIKDDGKTITIDLPNFTITIQQKN